VTAAPDIASLAIGHLQLLGPAPPARNPRIVRAYDIYPARDFYSTLGETSKRNKAERNETAVRAIVISLSTCRHFGILGRRIGQESDALTFCRFLEV